MRPWAPTLLNGRARPASLQLTAGVTYRLRLVNITADVNTIVTLADAGRPVSWRLLAKDGATVPSSQATLRPATLFFDPGEIYDFQFTPSAPGTLDLTFGPPPNVPPQFGVPKPVTIPVYVR